MNFQSCEKGGAMRILSIVALVVVIVSLAGTLMAYNDGNVWKNCGGNVNDFYVVPGGEYFWLYGMIAGGFGGFQLFVNDSTFSHLELGPLDAGICFSHRFLPPLRFASGTRFCFAGSNSNVLLYGYQGTSNPIEEDYGRNQEEPSNKAIEIHPIPFSDFASITYHVPKREKVSIKIFDPAGRVIKVLVDEVMEEGDYTAHWDGRDSNAETVSSGTYFCLIRTNGSDHLKLVYIE
jgi:hypothetical protein